MSTSRMHSVSKHFHWDSNRKAEHLHLYVNNIIILLLSLRNQKYTFGIYQREPINFKFYYRIITSIPYATLFPFLLSNKNRLTPAFITSELLRRASAPLWSIKLEFDWTLHACMHKNDPHDVDHILPGCKMYIRKKMKHLGYKIDCMKC